MRKGKFSRFLALLLAAVMLLGAAPLAIAADSSSNSNEDSYYRILHLDCGRKYFSVDYVKELIDAMSLNGFNQLQLAFGNAGLRFLLDDMSIMVSDTVSYDDATVRNSIVEGTKNQNSSGDGSYWTETDMTAILSYAATKGIEIVPLLNMPGHMNAILYGEQFQQYRISGKNQYNTSCTSATSLDPSNSEAVSFGLALLQKYVTWFTGKVNYFNFGADEVANDIVNPYYSYNSGYNDCVNYMNNCASIIKAAGMTPRCFNDFVYFSRNSGVSTDIEVCYWNNQWGGSPYVTASTLVSQNYKLINTNSNWYYVPNTGYTYEGAVTGINTYNVTQFRKEPSSYDTISGSNNVGAMLCVWCDDPTADAPLETVTNLMKAMADANSFPKRDTFTITAPDGTVADSENSTTPALALATNETMTLTASVSAVWESSNENVVEVQAITRGVTSESVTLIPVSTGSAIVTATADSGVSASFAVTVSEASLNEKEITLEVGATEKIAITGVNYAGTYSTADPAIATVTVTGQDGSPASTKYTKQTPTCNNLINYNRNDYWEKIEGYYYKVDENYYPLYAKRSTSTENWFTYYKYTWGYSETDSYLSVTKITTQNTYYTSDRINIDVYTMSSTDAVAASTTITFKGVSVGDTSVVIGDTRYAIHVVAKDEYIWINYFITNHRVKGTDGNLSLKVHANQVNTESGVLITDLVPEYGSDSENASHPQVKLYKVVAQTGSNIQIQAGWTNKTLKGDVVERLRYFNDQWAVYDGIQWKALDGDTTGFDPETKLKDGADCDGLVAITAYYAQVTQITDEITTYATDWGDPIANPPSLGDAYAVLDFAVKYESGDRSPDHFATANSLVYNAVGQSDYTYNSNGNTRIIKDLFVENNNSYEVYMITITKSNKLTTYSQNLSASTSITYPSTNEQVAWVSSETDLPDDFTTADKKYQDYTIGGDPAIAAIYVAKSYGYLVTYYVRSVSTDQVNVHYMDGTPSSSSEFYTYGINVKAGTTFKDDIQLNASNWKGNLTNGEVENDKGKTQIVSADLSTMPAIGAQYRYINYECTKVVRSDDGKDVYLYYTFSNTVTFVVDFGLPLVINPGDISNALTASNVTLTSATVTGANHGSYSVSDNCAITYTPDSRFLSSSNGEAITITYSGTVPTDDGGTKNGSAYYYVYLIPASNVLYEENFLTDSGSSWTMSSTASTATQTAESTDKPVNVFGYDSAYASATGEQGVLAVTGLTYSTTSSALTTEFYGNAFDLIGTCGPDTGRVMMLIRGEGESYIYDIDTRYSTGTLTQVPLAHAELATEGTYKVTIMASGLKATTVSGSASAAYTMNSNYDVALESFLAENGLNIYNVEYISLQCGAGSSSTMMTADTTATGTVEHQEGTHVELDAFRVYRSSSNSSYPTAEQNVSYVNILDAVQGTITAYTESNGEYTVDVDAYEGFGGPQNEIYLASGENKAVQIHLSDTALTEIQVSLRAVSGATSWNNKEITSNTEMYYTVAVTNGIATITNTGDGMLAIGNVKLPQGVTCTDPSEAEATAMVYSLRTALTMSVEPDEPEVPAYEPFVKVDVKSVNVIRNKLVTVTITTSTDVKTLTINGKTLKPTNSWLVKMGWSDTYTYVYVDTVKRGTTRDYEIIATNSDGLCCTYSTQG